MRGQQAEAVASYADSVQHAGPGVAATAIGDFLSSFSQPATAPGKTKQPAPAKNRLQMKADV
jgi:hypothetical protein